MAGFPSPFATLKGEPIIRSTATRQTVSKCSKKGTYVDNRFLGRKEIRIFSLSRFLISSDATTNLCAESPLRSTNSKQTRATRRRNIWRPIITAIMAPRIAQRDVSLNCFCFLLCSKCNLHLIFQPGKRARGNPYLLGSRRRQRRARRCEEREQSFPSGISPLSQIPGYQSRSGLGQQSSQWPRMTPIITSKRPRASNLALRVKSRRLKRSRYRRSD